MIVKRREIPEAAAWLAAALAVITGAALGWRAVTRKVHAHNATARQRRSDWGIEAEEA